MYPYHASSITHPPAYTLLLVHKGGSAIKGGKIITIMKNLALKQISILNHSSILDFQLSNLYRAVKSQRSHSLPRGRSDPVTTQIYIHNFSNNQRLPLIEPSGTTKRSLTIIDRDSKSKSKPSMEQRAKRFETLPSDIECISKFQMSEEKRKLSAKEDHIGKKQFIEVDILTLETWYAKNESTLERKFKEKVDLNEEIKSITPLPSKAGLATFIQNYKTTNSQVDVDSLVKSPLFGVNFKEGNMLYFGDIRNNEMDGKGVLVTLNWIFEGVFMSSKRLEGVEITPKGIYKGKFVNDDRSKVGQFYWNNGEYYSGEWVKNKKHGTGVWKSKNGDVYMGQWVKGKVHGYGCHLTKKGQKYEGYFENFLKHGQGKEYFPNGDYFEGTFHYGKPTGTGIYKWRSGITYEGQFKQGFREGRGIIKKTQIQYEGSFIKQRAHGQGRITVWNGDSFKGSFKRGKKEGRGIQRQNKTIFVGSWHQNRFIYQAE